MTSQQKKERIECIKKALYDSVEENKKATPDYFRARMKIDKALFMEWRELSSNPIERMKINIVLNAIEQAESKLKDETDE